MASQSRVSFSGADQQISDIAQHYRYTDSSIKLYFSSRNPKAEVLFAGTSQTEIQAQLDRVTDENEQLVSMNLLSAIEAVFRIDYLQRCYKRKKDPLSLAFREVHRIKGSRASLEDDIFEAWRIHSNIQKQLISDLKSAFKYRHWLAHGRYWTPKMGRKYDYFSIYSLGQIIESSFPLEGQ